MYISWFIYYYKLLYIIISIGFFIYTAFHYCYCLAYASSSIDNFTLNCRVLDITEYFLIT